jgi:hypothetical protein
MARRERLIGTSMLPLPKQTPEIVSLFVRLCHIGESGGFLYQRRPLGPTREAWLRQLERRCFFAWRKGYMDFVGITGVVIQRGRVLRMFLGEADSIG